MKQYEKDLMCEPVDGQSHHQIRPAAAQDLWPIRQLVLRAKLDPTQLRWQQFFVIEHQGKIIACGQLRSFPQAQELGSMVVARSWRGKGLGSRMVKHLIGVAEAPLYLECLGTGLAQFYGKFGFKSIALEVIAPGLQPKFRFSQQVAKVFGLPLSLMHYQPELEESQSGAKQLGGNQ